MIEISISIVLFAAGVLVLLKGADLLVSGATSVAAVLRISPIMIGLTVVAFGTSSPELIVSLTSAISGNTDVALGNIIGSNIANILLILGASALLYPLKVQRNTVWKEIPMSFLGAVILTVLALQQFIDNGNFHQIPLSSTDTVGFITASNGIVLLSFFIIFLYYTFGIAKVSGNISPDIQKRSISSSVLRIVIGLIGLILGSKLLVDNGIDLARIMGVSDAFIGLTLVAVGTSLPELITSLVAAYKKQVDIAVGNIVGSNIFNIFFVLGITSLVKPLPLPGINVADTLVLFGATIILFLSLFVRQKHTISKLEGSIMLSLYLGYIVFLVNRG